MRKYGGVEEIWIYKLTYIKRIFVVNFGVFFLNGDDDDGFFWLVYMRVKILRNLLYVVSIMLTKRLIF